MHNNVLLDGTKTVSLKKKHYIGKDKKMNLFLEILNRVKFAVVNIIFIQIDIIQLSMS